MNLNPSYDNWVLLNEKPKVNNVLRGKNVVRQIDGKGLNIGRVFDLFGFNDYICINMLGGEVGKLIEKTSKRLGLRTENFWINDENRINTAIVHGYEGRHDVVMVNESGPVVTSDEVSRFKSFYENILKPGDLVVISGSAAEGFTPSDLAEIAELSLSKQAVLAVDISNEWLIEIVNKKISILKINNDEIKVAFGVDPNSMQDLEAFRKNYNIDDLIITYGKKGAVYLNNHERYRVFPPEMKADYAVGSGDSFFAGFLLNVVQGVDVEKALIGATACGAANASCFGAALFGMEAYERCINGVVLKEVNHEMLLGN